MKLGFLGSGTIAASVMRGLMKANLKIEHIYASTTNMAARKALETEIAGLKLTQNNQLVADNADIIFLALPGQVCEKIVAELSFRPGQKLVSFAPTESIAALEKITGHKIPVFRAVPLPFIAEHKILTPIFPADREIHDIFAHIGGALDLKSEQDLRLFMMAGSFMGVYYAFLNSFSEWMKAKTGEKTEAALYLAKIFNALSEEAVKQEEVDFPKLEKEYSTKGGTNEMISRLMREYGGFETLKKALDETFQHISS